VSDYVELTIPASAEYLSLARLHVGAIATRIDMTIDELEDLQLAVEELCLTLLDPPPVAQSRLVVAVTWADDAVEVTCRLDAAGSGPTVAASGTLPAALSARILDALVDDHGTESGRAWLRKRREQRPSAQ